MRIRMCALAVLLVLGSGVLWGSNANAQQTQPTTWGQIKAGYGISDLVQPVRPSNPPVEQPVYEPWTLQPAQVVMQKFHVPSADIKAVQKVVVYKNGMPSDSAMAVVTDKQWYYVSLDGHTVRDSPNDRFRLTTEMDVYGSYLGLINNGTYCQTQEWAAVFYMPTCFHEISPGRFSEITDAWAQTPSCSAACNGGYCALWLCGSAWDGAGYNGWWDYKDCGSSTSRKVGKQVQKRWMYTWNQCYGYSFNYIASMVRAHIRY